jgi:hypothetical protein
MIPLMVKILNLDAFDEVVKVVPAIFLDMSKDVNHTCVVGQKNLLKKSEVFVLRIGCVIEGEMYNTSAFKMNLLKLELCLKLDL